MNMKSMTVSRLELSCRAAKIIAHWPCQHCRVLCRRGWGRLMLFNANIPIYEPARVNHEPKRPRELLVKAKERNRLLGLIRREGVTLVPLNFYFNNRGLAKHKSVWPRVEKSRISGRRQRIVIGVGKRRGCCALRAERQEPAV